MVDAYCKEDADKHCNDDIWKVRFRVGGAIRCHGRSQMRQKMGVEICAFFSLLRFLMFCFFLGTLI